MFSQSVDIPSGVLFLIFYLVRFTKGSLKHKSTVYISRY
uniref:Uncharacterized protein n=1 Tax=Anguilla anguilla TaxID=7936 RepID=A0A0E9SYL0_ANGAN